MSYIGWYILEVQICRYQKQTCFLGEVSWARVRAILLPDFPFLPLPALVFHLANLLATNSRCRKNFHVLKEILIRFILFSKVQCKVGVGNMGDSVKPPTCRGSEGLLKGRRWKENPWLGKETLRPQPTNDDTRRMFDSQQRIWNLDIKITLMCRCFFFMLSRFIAE